jgi:5-amino-6-(5-phosphoribosylamino)uracil reductase
VEVTSVALSNSLSNSPITLVGTPDLAATSSSTGALDWTAVLPMLYQCGFANIAVLGGGTLVGAIAAAGALNELWLTVCPILLGGERSPTPVDGPGFHTHLAPRLQLLTAETLGQEVFLHYRVMAIGS